MPLDTRGWPIAPPGRIGPNAIIQTAVALADLAGAERTEAMFSAAGVADYVVEPPEEMVDEGHVRALFDAIVANLEPNLANAVLAEAGRLTGQYVLDYRIPKPAQRVLTALPGFVSGPLLTRAIALNAWTFAGSGRLSYRTWPRIEITITDNPIATPGCRWHCAVFERLYRRLASRRARATHGPGVGQCGRALDRFVIAL